MCSWPSCISVMHVPAPGSYLDDFFACRSSLDTAIAERRLRVRVSEAGTVIDEAEAAAAAAKLDMGPDVAADAEEGAAVIVERPTTAAAAAQAMGEELEALFGFTKEAVRIGEQVGSS